VFFFGGSISSTVVVRGSLEPQYHKIGPEVKALQEENARLQKIIGNQALELEFKTELFKKSDAYERKLKGL
jgi:hypothetical protein